MTREGVRDGHPGVVLRQNHGVVSCVVIQSDVGSVCNDINRMKVLKDKARSFILFVYPVCLSCLFTLSTCCHVYLSSALLLSAVLRATVKAVGFNCSSRLHRGRVFFLPAAPQNPFITQIHPGKRQLLIWQQKVCHAVQHLNKATMGSHKSLHYI